jgi:hypothetical protein
MIGAGLYFSTCACLLVRYADDSVPTHFSGWMCPLSNTSLTILASIRGRCTARGLGFGFFFRRASLSLAGSSSSDERMSWSSGVGDRGLGGAASSVLHLCLQRLQLRSPAKLSHECKLGMLTSRPYRSLRLGLLGKREVFQVVRVRVGSSPLLSLWGHGCVMKPR